MYNIYFYKDAKGKEPVFDYINELRARSDKDSRIKFCKIMDYIEVLSLRGTLAGEPFIKHLDGEIWELRPLRDRILFAGWIDGGFVLLHTFIKKTQKTPAREIKRAKKELANFMERGLEDEE